MKFNHYAVLLIVNVARLTGDKRGLRPSQIQARLDLVLTSEQLGRVLSQLCDPAYHEDAPLLRLDRQRYVICGRDDSEGEEQTGGFKVLAEARSNRGLPNREREWIDRMRWPSTAADSARNTVVVPTGSTRGGYMGDPERALGRTTTRTRFAELSREGFKWCPRCKGWRLLEEYSGKDRYCRLCRKLLARKRRSKNYGRPQAKT